LQQRQELLIEHEVSAERDERLLGERMVTEERGENEERREQEQEMAQSGVVS